MRKHLSCLALLLCSAAAHCAQLDPFTIPGFELVHNAPTNSNADSPDLRDPVTVWTRMFDEAGKTIDVGQFYVAGQPGSQLDKVLDSLEAAGRRGVKIRFLMDQKGLKLSDAPTLARIRSIPNLAFRTMDFGRLSGGIIHAKYFVVDRRTAFLGSQNFDWRALEHIDETGLRIGDPVTVRQISAIFEQDWKAQEALAAGRVPPRPTAARSGACESRTSFLAASPAAYNPACVADSGKVLPQLIGSAKRSIQVQVMTYAPLEFSETHKRVYYPVIDTALRAAATRGVRVQLLVANWNLKKPDVSYLQSLALVPNVEVRVVTVPPAASGFIPYARVVHSKIMSIDDEIAWVGTSNWSGGYLDKSRNLEVVMRDPKMAQRVRELHQVWWNSPHTAPIDVARDYPAPHPAEP